MKLCELLAGISLRGNCFDPELDISSITCDSRAVKPGGLFAALRGSKTDGHRCIGRALERGAAAVLCEVPPETPGPWLWVEDSRSAFGALAANWFGRPGDELVVVGITGTNGKTTTTNLLRELLEQFPGTKVGLIGTNRNLIGTEEVPAERTTPDSYALQKLLRRMADSGCTHVVMEASSHALAQHRTAGVTFDVGVFTNLTRDHLDYHRTMEDYRAAKGRLFDRCRCAVLNLDDEAGRFYRSRVRCPVFTYSQRDLRADLTAEQLRLAPDHVEFEALMLGKLARVYLPIPGGFSAYNALAALSAGLCLGYPLEKLAQGLRRVRGVKGRVEVVPVDRDFTVLIDYAHSPDALENILLTARSFTPGRLFCLFGCGGDRDRTKRPIMGEIARTLADCVVVTSDNPRTEDPEAIIRDILEGSGPESDTLHVEPDRPAAIRWALSHARKGDVVVLAGKGHELTQEVNGVKHPMDERQIVTEWLENASISEEKTGNPPAGIV